jgi:CheY-like chemotaxis protein
MRNHYSTEPILYGFGLDRVGIGTDLAGSHKATQRSSASILVVDDDLDSLTALAEILSYAGYAVVTARSGCEAIERIHNSQALRLLILDLVLPDMDGFRLLEQLRQEPDLARMPVIVMSGLEERANGHVQVRKPVEVGHLLNVIKLMLVSEPGMSEPEI